MKVNKIADVLKVKLIKTNSKVSLKDRSCFHVVARIFYVFIKALYIGALYYFIPFVIVSVEERYTIVKKGPEK